MNIFETKKLSQNKKSCSKRKSHLTFYSPIKHDNDNNKHDNEERSAIYNQFKGENNECIHQTLLCLQNKDSFSTDINPKQFKINKRHDRIVSFNHFTKSYKFPISSYNNARQKKTLLSDYKNQSACVSSSEIQKKLISLGMKLVSNRTKDTKPNKTMMTYEKTKGKRANSQCMKQNPIKKQNTTIVNPTKRSSSSHNRREKYDITEADCHIIDYYYKRNNRNNNHNTSCSFSNIKPPHNYPNQKTKTNHNNSQKDIQIQKIKDIPIAEINLCKETE